MTASPSNLAPILITSPAQLPPVWTRGIVAPTFASALAEYERKYGAAARCWQYRDTYYFEAQP